jgi:formylglycine-generating enzyme required for sulfatase activity
MPDTRQPIYISYAWGGESERIVGMIKEAVDAAGLRLVIDKRELDYRESVRKFMERLGRGECVIVVISDRYLRSHNCMFELLEMAKNADFHARIFPIVLADADIYKGARRAAYIRYWEEQIEELNEAMRGLKSQADLAGLRDEIDLYTRIRAEMARLTDILQDMNTLTPAMHEERHFETLIDHLQARLAGGRAAPQAAPPAQGNLPPAPAQPLERSTPSPEMTKTARARAGLLKILGSNLSPSERAEAGRSLAAVGDPRPEVMTCAGMQFCFVPGGLFRMGADDGYPDEKPAHPCDLPAYWIGRYPVTQAQFGEFCAAGGYGAARWWSEARAAGLWNADGYKGPGDGAPRQAPAPWGEPFDLPNHPVVGVSWYEALTFVRWLREEWGVPAFLPSEAEWEKAARGGLEIPLAPVLSSLSEGLTLPRLPLHPNPLPQRRYPWGDEDDPTRANYAKTGIGATSAVGCFLGGASPYGLQDLSGNVWEWTRSIWKDYPYISGDGREILSGDSPRVFRGGAFSYSRRRVRCASRDWVDPANLVGNLGFRAGVFPPTSDL